MGKVGEPVRDELLQSFSKKFDSIIEKFSFPRLDTVNEYSTSACWEVTTVGGGAKAYLSTEHVKNGHTSNDELLLMDYHPRSGTSERRGFATMRLRTLLDDCPVTDCCKAMVYPICEPLKVRNITKSNAYQYAIAKGLQLDIHSQMKQFFQFRLIGEPLHVSHIERLVARSPSGVFASGDFSAATDNVKIQLTKLFFERIINRLLHFCVIEPKHVKVLRDVLYEHEVHYPTGYGEDLDPVLQKNGQLMGSVLSFPFLCFINLVCYWEAVEPEVEDFRKLNVMVNGDDILFRTTPEKYGEWLKLLPETGLTPSPGKNFLHERYCTVNSELFSVTGKTVKQIPFFNVGMLLGQSKVCRSEIKQKPIHCLHNEVVTGALNPVRAHLRFIFYNNDRLRKSSQSADGHQLNYCIPRELGGLGMSLSNMTYISSERAVKLSGQELEALLPYTIVNKMQRSIANKLYNAWTQPYLKPPMKPIGFQVDEDAEENHFPDVKNSDYHIRIHADCPMPPWCREKRVIPHEPNWMSPPMDSAELERLKFCAKGVRYTRGSGKILCHLLKGLAFKEYKWIGGEENYSRPTVQFPLYEETDSEGEVVTVCNSDSFKGVPHTCAGSVVDDCLACEMADYCSCDFVTTCVCNTLL